MAHERGCRRCGCVCSSVGHCRRGRWRQCGSGAHLILGLRACETPMRDMLAIAETTVYVDCALLYGGPSLREVQRPEFDTWRNNLFGCKDGVQGRVWGNAFNENVTISFQQNAENRKSRATKRACGNMAPSKNIIRKRWFPHHGSAIEQRPTIQPTFFAPPSKAIRLNHSFLLCIFFCSKAISSLYEFISLNLHGR